MALLAAISVAAEAAGAWHDVVGGVDGATDGYGDMGVSVRQLEGGSNRER